MINPLQQLGFSTQTIRFWRNLQRRLYQHNFVAIDFVPEGTEPTHWQMLLGPGKMNIIKAINWGQGKAAGLKMNKHLLRLVAEYEYVPNKSFWKSMESGLSMSGCLVPDKELSRLEESQLEEHLLFIRLKHQYFPHIQLLKGLKNSMLEKKHLKVPVGIKAMWLHFRSSVDFMKTIREKELLALARMADVLKEQNGLTDFDTFLPSHQLQLILYRHLYSFHLQIKDDSLLQKMLSKSIPSVGGYFERYKEWLEDFYNKGFGQEAAHLPKNTENELKSRFYEVGQEDEKFVQIQEIIDDASEEHFAKFLSPNFSEKYDPRIQKKNLKQRLEQSLGDRSIMDRIQAVSEQLRTRKQPKFGPEAIAFYHPSTLKWYQLNVDEQSALLDDINKFKPKQLKVFKRRCIIRWSYQLQNRLNAVYAPFLVWENEDGLLYPQWNFFDSPRSGDLQYEFYERRIKEKEETERLEHLLKELQSKQTMLKIRQLKEDASAFTLEENIERWKHAIESQELTVRNQMNYRMRRMREFSILEGEEQVTYRREIWLDEMLEIEEEVKPFILFVKKAFQAALPVRRSVEFDPYRHSHDGVEFDPMTVQDQDKWMRANVMRTLRKKIDRGEVIQVNAFALDSSGSMEHERMRNLFKILYLLVLGLEDRKSYDAFHFFSTYFNETANFTNLYTNRRLLFKVLRKIATISDWQVKYGGGGGTNISEAIEQSYIRIQNYVKKLKDIDPEANIACSLFVITDGEPTVGITDLPELAAFIEEKRKEGDVAIKGIFIKEEEAAPDFMEQIFGAQHYVETTDFSEAVNKFVTIMTQTYKAQRRAFKWKKKRKGNRGAGE